MCVCVRARMCVFVSRCSTMKTHTPQFTNRPGPHSVLPPLAPALSVQCIFYSHHLLLTVILNSLNLPFQHAQSKDIFPHLCIVSEVLVYIFYDMRYIILMVNGYISWIYRSI